MTNFDVAIIGGGHNGLVAATYLAKAGKSVVILEANAEVGGATTSVRAFPEYDAMLSRYSYLICLLYTSPSPRDRQKSRMPSSA